MNIKSRVEKLEMGIEPANMRVIAIFDYETHEQAFVRAFPAGTVRPKVIIYANKLDVLL